MPEVLALKAFDEAGLVSASAARRVSRGIMRALETRSIIPGQRLVEGELAAQYGVGRNAVREAVQWLAAHGVMDTTRFRSSAVRLLSPKEAQETLDVFAVIIELCVCEAARNFDVHVHGELLRHVLGEMASTVDSRTPGAYGRARRHAYKALISISGNGELLRLFPALGLHVVHAQFHGQGSEPAAHITFRAIGDAVSTNDQVAGKLAAHAFVCALRSAIGR
jgi:DNA-binding GntR family transcriptional regulator